jgi:hypothetical protein
MRLFVDLIYFFSPFSVLVMVEDSIIVFYRHLLFLFITKNGKSGYNRLELRWSFNQFKYLIEYENNKFLI